MTLLLGLGFCPVAHVTNSLNNNHQRASRKYKSAIHYPQEREYHFKAFPELRRSRFPLVCPELL